MKAAVRAVKAVTVRQLAVRGDDVSSRAHVCDTCMQSHMQYLTEVRVITYGVQLCSWPQAAKTLAAQLITIFTKLPHRGVL